MGSGSVTARGALLAAWATLTACGSFGEDGAAAPSDAGGVDAARADAGAVDASSCDAGACRELVAKELPLHLAGAGSVVAWVTGDRVRASIAGGPAHDVTVAGSFSSFPGWVGVFGAEVSFATEGSLATCDLSGPCNPPKDVLVGLAGAGPVAVDGKDRFVTEQSGLRRVLRCAAGSSCESAGAVEITKLTTSAAAIAVTAARVVVALDDGSVTSYARGGGGAVPLGKAGALGGLVAAPTGEVYWTDATSKAIVEAADGAGNATPLASGFAAPGEVALEGDRLYFLDGETVKTCTRDACSDVTTLAKVGSPVHIAVADRVYVASAADGAIYAFSK